MDERLRALGTKTAILILALVLAAVGYVLAPANLAPGEYTAEIVLEIEGAEHRITHAFAVADGELSAAPELVETRYPLDNYTLVVRSPATVGNALGAQVRYVVEALDANGAPATLDLARARSTLEGPGYRQELPPTESEAGRAVFAMRVPYGAKITTALLFVLPVLWLSEVVPLAATSILIPVVAVVSGIVDDDTVLQPFAHPIIALFLAGFLLAEGMRRTGVDRRIALLILSRASLRPAMLMLTMMALTAFMSMWMSNTAAVAILIPIALTVLERIPSDGTPPGYARALILAIAYAATIGGTGSAIGTPANMLALTFLNEYSGGDFAFIDWFAFGLPVVILMVPIIWLYLLLSFRVNPLRMANLPGREVYVQDMAALGPVNGQQKVLGAVFVGVMALWLTETWHGVPTGIVALTGAFVLFFTRVIRQEDLSRINWNALLTFGGGLAIGTLLVSTGVSDWVALQLTGLQALSVPVMLLMLSLLTLTASAFISNTACAAIFIPLAIPLSQVLGIDTRLVVALVAIASSLDFALIVGTPPTMMAYSTGIFRASDIFQRGLALDIIGAVVLSQVVIYIWWLLGVVQL